MPGDQERYKHLISMGHTYAWDLDWEQAAEQYLLALDEFPESAQAISSLAAAYYELGQLEDALSFYRRAAKKNPKDPLILEKIAQILELQGQNKAGAEVALLAAELHLKAQDIKKAVENWMLTIALNPENLRARSRLALTYERQRQTSKAVAQYLIIASLLQHSNNKERAIEVVEHVLKLSPDHPEAVQILGLLRANQNLPLPEEKPKRTERLPASREREGKPKELEEPDLDDPDPVKEAEKTALAELAKLMFEQGEEQSVGRESRSFQSIAMGTGPLNRMHVERTQIMLHLSQAVDLQSRGLGRQAIEELERAVDAGLDQSAAYFNIGLLKNQFDSPEEALKALQTAVKHPDYSIASRLLMGKILIEMGRYKDGSIEYLEALRVADAGLLPAEQYKGLYQAYETIIDNYFLEENEDIHKRLSDSIANLLWQTGWRDKLRQARQQLPNQPPDMAPMPLAELLTESENSHLVEALGRIHQLSREGRYRLAMEEAFLAIELSPTYLPLHTFMGEILMQQDRIQEAIIKFNTIARAYSSRGEATRSIELFRRITQLAPLDLSARHRLIELLTASGKMEETIQEYIDLGNVYYRLAELDKARETYQKALNQSQQSEVSQDWRIEILHHLADIDIQRLDWPRAIRIFEQIARQNPGDKKATMGLIELNFRIAEETAALAAMGNYLAYLNRSGRQHEALDTLVELLENNTEQIAIKRSLAEQYQLVGNREKAIEMWEGVIDTLEETGDSSGTIRALQALIALDPPKKRSYERSLEELQQFG